MGPTVCKTQQQTTKITATKDIVKTCVQLYMVPTLFISIFSLQDLRQELKSEISGKFENLVLALLETPVKFDTKEVHDAISVCMKPFH